MFELLGVEVEPPSLPTDF